MPRCLTCAAHKDTIAALHMVIQAQNQSLKLLAERQQPVAPAAPEPGGFLDQIAAVTDGVPVEVIGPHEEHRPRLWKTDDEEVLQALHQEGYLDDTEYERRLAALQAADPPVVSIIR